MKNATVLLVLLLALGLFASLRPGQARPPPPRQDAAQALLWMADCLPGIGPKGRERALAAIRAGDWARLPAKAQAVARDCFGVMDPSP